MSGAYAHRRRIGRFGEDLAAGFLVRQGARVVGRNVRIGRGEIDLVAAISGVRTAVEVKTVVGEATDAAEAFTDSKASQVRMLAASLEPPAHRVDLITVRLNPGGVTIRWIPHAA